jgi:predicted alpha-1,2-mannosidase
MRASVVFSALFCVAFSSSVLDLVDPFIGTGGKGYGCGAVPPGAQLPFSGVRLSADTSHTLFPVLPYEHFGGYQYADNEIRVFSHLHTQGAGVLDMGILSVMPVAQRPSAHLVTDENYRSRFSHAHESASPGYYSVLLETHGVQAELTAGVHSAAHRYRWGAKGEAVILFPLSHAMPQHSCKDASVAIDVSKQVVTGQIETTGGFSASGLTAYFVARFNTPFSAFGAWVNGSVTSSASSANGTNIGGYVSFGAAKTVEMYVGVSWISIEQAWKNLAAEQAGQSFDATLANAKATWLKTLSRVSVEGGSREDLTKFYTALYHIHCAPSTVSESGGMYVGFDKSVHQLSPTMNAYYSDLSMWDVHRTQMPFLAWLYGESVMGDIVESVRLMAEQLRYLPNWPFVNTNTCTMIGQFGQNIVAEAYLWGVRNFNVTGAYEAIKNAALGDQPCGRSNTALYEQLGFLPLDVDSYGSCRTLAWAHNDFAIAAMAQGLGRASEYAFFSNRSSFYKNVWSHDDSYYCPRFANGTFKCPANKFDFLDNHFVEGDSWHYRFHGHQPMKLFKSERDFVEQLDKFMTLGRLDPFNVLPNPYYWAGNEPGILSPWLFAWANRSDLTIRHTHWVLQNRYSTQPDGVPGNDDYGAISGWLVWAYLGIYPLYSGNSAVSVAAPIFPRVTLTRDSGATVVLERTGSGELISQLLVNGARVSSSIVSFQELLSGQQTTLSWTMAAQ